MASGGKGRIRAGRVRLNRDGARHRAHFQPGNGHHVNQSGPNERRGKTAQTAGGRAEQNADQQRRQIVRQHTGNRLAQRLTQAKGNHLQRVARVMVDDPEAREAEHGVDALPSR